MMYVIFAVLFVGFRALLYNHMGSFVRFSPVKTFLLFNKKKKHFRIGLKSSKHTKFKKLGLGLDWTFTFA